MKKYVICLAVAGTILVTNVTSAFAATMLFVDNINVPNINLEIVDSTTFVPLRTIAETLGYKVTFDTNTKTVYVGDEFTHKVGTTYVTLKNGEIKDIGVPSYIRNGTTYVSLRLFSEALGYEVKYDEKTKNIWIYSGNLPDTTEDKKEVEETYNDKYSESLVTGKYTVVNKSENKLSDTITTNTRNQSGILLKGATSDISRVTVNKTGNTTSLSGSVNNGLNSAVLVKDNSKLVSTGLKVNASAIGADGIYLDKSTANISDLKLNVDGYSADAVVVRNGSNLSLSNFDINLNNNLGTAFIVEDSNELKLNKGTATTLNNNFIKTNSDVTLNSVNFNTTDGNFGSIDTNNFTSNSSNLYSSSGNGFVINNGKSTVDKTTVNLNGGSLTIPHKTLFTVNDRNTVFNLNGITLSKVNNLVDVKNTDNGLQTLDINAKNQILTGNILIDDKVTTNINLSAKSYLNGSINSTDANADVIVDIDTSSSWDVTKDSYVDVINPSIKSFTNINGNGFNVYYNAKNSKNSWLAEKQYWLNGGGKLIPVK